MSKKKSSSIRRRLWPECDVVVLGGGPAGAAAAITLARAGRLVVVIEKSRYDQSRVGETLPPAARPLLVALAVWEPFLAAGHLPSPGVSSAWGEAELYQTHFVLNAYGQGWHLDRRTFDHMLAGAVRESGACLHCDAEATSCVRSDGWWQFSFTVGDASGRRDHGLRARYLVDATGRAAVLARRQGAKRLNTDRLVGLSGVLAARAQREGADACDPCTLVEACADGWWYSALLPGRRLIAVYLTDADLLRRHHTTWQAFWHALLQRTTHTQSRLDAFELEASPRVVAAASSRLDRVNGHGWVAVGDAAMAFDPLSSKGLTHALASGIRAGEALDGALAGEAAVLDAYGTRAKETFREYARLRAIYYGREQRWPQSAFWRRRQAAAV
jgi:flavin-dependent dehydrogenase